MKSLITAPWAIQPEKLTEIQEIYITHLRGEKIGLAGIEARVDLFDDRSLTYENRNGRAIIRVVGPVTHKPGILTWLLDGTASQIVAQSLRAARDDDKVKSIILYIDSPGGMVAGTQELAREVYAVREKKPVVAYTDGMLASAAYWIGAAADRIFISGDTTQVGAIGVVARHIDISKYEEKIGVKTSEIVAGRYKRVASQYEPLSESGRQSIQDAVDHIYTVFLGDVSRFRNLSLDTVKEGKVETIPWADGRVFYGKQAIEAGLADGQMTYTDLLHADLEKLVKQPRLRLLKPIKTASVSENPTRSIGGVASVAPPRETEFHNATRDTVNTKIAALKMLQDPTLSPAERILIVWKNDDKLRQEFKNNLCAYAAWELNKEKSTIVKDIVHK